MHSHRNIHTLIQFHIKLYIDAGGEWMGGFVQAELKPGFNAKKDVKDTILNIYYTCGSKMHHSYKPLMFYVENDHQINNCWGRSKLFKIQHCEKYNWKFKIECIVSIPFTKCINPKVVPKRRQLQILDFPGFKTLNPAKKRKIELDLNKSRPYKGVSSIKDEWSISKRHMLYGINIISDKLGERFGKAKAKDLFDIYPTDDCFSSDKNYQRDCKFHITFEMDYFSSKYDDPDYWKDKCAWCFPPYHRKTIVDAINSFPRRKMKGYVFTPYEKGQTWIAQTQKICEAYCIMPKRLKSPIQLNPDPYFCYFDSILFYFDFSKKKQP